MIANYLRKHSLQPRQATQNRHRAPRLRHAKAKTDCGRAVGPFAHSCDLAGSTGLRSRDIQEPMQRPCPAQVPPPLLHMCSPAMWCKPAGSSESLALLNCCSSFALPGFSGTCLHVPATLTWCQQDSPLSPRSPGSSSYLCNCQADLLRAIWLPMTSLCSFLILISWGVLKSKAKSRQKHMPDSQPSNINLATQTPKF